MDDVKPKWWQVFAAGVTVTLLGLCAIGVGTVGLGAADQLASVGSFALTGVGTLVTVASLVQAVRQQRQRPLVVGPAEPPPPAPPSGVAPLAADLARLRDVTNVDHERLFGVDEAIDRLGESLRNPGGASIISIFGGAGVGKTALAYELIRRHAEEAGFRRVASVSAKFSHIDRVGHLERDAERENVDWHALLVELAQQLAQGSDFNDTLIEQQLPQAMPAEPCLIVVDNLETREAEVAVRYLAGSGILDPHKVVITTREAVAGTGVGRLRELTWDGPDHAAASAYARYLVADDSLLDPRKSDLDDVVRAAERTPLLIQIIINQARVERLPIRDVIGRLRDVSGNLGRAVWTYCYVNSLNVLEQKLRDPGLPEESAREQAADTVANLMAVFCFRPAGSSIASEDFFELSQIGDREAFLRARAMACRLALVKSLRNNERFTVHSLLREFYCAQRGPCGSAS
ncbi:AAA family ATPase [Micromonospora sp. PTRAS2]